MDTLEVTVAIADRVAVLLFLAAELPPKIRNLRLILCNSDATVEKETVSEQEPECAVAVCGLCVGQVYAE